jgi:hypothetical protein
MMNLEVVLFFISLNLAMYMINNAIEKTFCSQKGAVGVKQPYIRVVGLEQSRDNNSNGPSNFTLDEVVSKVYIYKGDIFYL